MTNGVRDRAPGGLDLPPDAAPEGPGGSGWARLLTARNEIEAHLVAGRLDAAGIQVQMHRDHRGPSWLTTGSDPRSPVTLMVLRIQLEDARIVLAEIALEQPEDAASRPQRHVRPLAWWALALTLGVVLSAIGLARTADDLRRCASGASCAEHLAP